MEGTDVIRITIDNYPESCRLFRIGLVHTHADVEKAHIHDHFQIILIKSGIVNHYLGNKAVKLVGGDMFLIPPNIAHRIEYLTDTVSFYCMDFLDSFVEYDPVGQTISDRLLSFLLMDSLLGASIRTQPKISLDKDESRFMMQQAEWLYFEFHKRRESMFDLMQSLLLSMLYVFGRKYLYETIKQEDEQKYRRYSSAMQDTIRFIGEHYAKKLVLDDCIKRVAMSRSCFCTLFKQQTGMPFHEYLSQLRLENAMRLLAETDLTLEAVSEQTGFNDASGLYRHFMQFTGMSPGQYRTLHRRK